MYDHNTIKLGEYMRELDKQDRHSDAVEQRIDEIEADVVDFEDVLVQALKNGSDISKPLFDLYTEYVRGPARLNAPKNLIDAVDAIEIEVIKYAEREKGNG